MPLAGVLIDRPGAPINGDHYVNRTQPAWNRRYLDHPALAAPLRAPAEPTPPGQGYYPSAVGRIHGSVRLLPGQVGVDGDTLPGAMSALSRSAA